MKILSIGNSFSQDAQRYLYRLAKKAGDTFKTVNLDIGGCTDYSANFSFRLVDNTHSSFYYCFGIFPSRMDKGNFKLFQKLNNMVRKKKQKMQLSTKIALVLLLLAVILTLLQYIFKTFLGVDLGITFFGQEMFW